MAANPYLELDLEALAEAFHRRAGELLKEGVQRSATERATLARDTAYLLLAAARVMEPGWAAPTAPEKALGHGNATLAEVFGGWAEALQRGVRHRVLVRAVNVAIAGNPVLWLQRARLDGRALSDVAVESDTGLRLALAHLQALMTALGRRPQR